MKVNGAEWHRSEDLLPLPDIDVLVLHRGGSYSIRRLINDCVFSTDRNWPRWFGPREGPWVEPSSLHETMWTHLPPWHDVNDALAEIERAQEEAFNDEMLVDHLQVSLRKFRLCNLNRIRVWLRPNDNLPFPQSTAWLRAISAERDFLRRYAVRPIWQEYIHQLTGLLKEMGFETE
jgi:hypothetical protein